MHHFKTYKIRLINVLALLALVLEGCGPLSWSSVTQEANPGHPTALLPAITITRVPAAVTPEQPSATSGPAKTEPTATTYQPATQPPATATRAATPVTSATSAAPKTAANPYDCRPSPAVQAMAEQVQPEPWLDWIRQLSGEQPVSINGETVTLTTRFTPAMFANDANGKATPSAFDFVHETLRSWYPESQIEVQPFTAKMRSDQPIEGKNLILTLPGKNRSAQPVLLTAHLDSRAATSDSMTRAPGADDNASGSAALLEAARLLRGRRLERPLRLIWFTGEEQGLLGSQAYVKSLPDPRHILGVINLDMFAYDGNQDDLFEIHAGKLPDSVKIAGCFIEAYQVTNHLPPADPPTFELLTEQAINASDHGSFWAVGVGAIVISENILPPNDDFNPNYHSTKDTIDRLDPLMAIRIVRGALTAAASLAGLQ